MTDHPSDTALSLALSGCNILHRMRKAASGDAGPKLRCFGGMMSYANNLIGTAIDQFIIVSRDTSAFRA